MTSNVISIDLNLHSVLCTCFSTGFNMGVTSLALFMISYTTLLYIINEYMTGSNDGNVHVTIKDKVLHKVNPLYSSIAFSVYQIRKGTDLKLR